MKELYLVNYSSQDEGFRVNVFATHDKNVADKWVNKFNVKLNYWKELLKEYQDEYKSLDEKYWNHAIGQIYYKVKNINYAFYETIELRKK